jgi:hypothetical protein
MNYTINSDQLALLLANDRGGDECVDCGVFVKDEECEDHECENHKEATKMVVFCVFSNDLLKYFEVNDGCADKDTEEQNQYRLEVEEDWGDSKCYFNLRWRFIEDRCDAPESLTKGKTFQTMCSSWSVIKHISTSSSFAANLDYWIEEDEE